MGKMKVRLLACLALACGLGGAGPEPPLDFKMGDIPPVKCDENSGIVIKLEKGGSITGPFTIDETTGFFRYPDGSMRAATEDMLNVTAGQTITGPITFCSRINKP